MNPPRLHNLYTKSKHNKATRILDGMYGISQGPHSLLTWRSLSLLNRRDNISRGRGLLNSSDTLSCVCGYAPIWHCGRCWRCGCCSNRFCKRHQWQIAPIFDVCMMTSSNGNIFRVTGQWCGALMFTLICTRINVWVNNRKAGDLRRNRVHYDVIVMGKRSWKIKIIKKTFFTKFYSINVYSYCILPFVYTLWAFYSL